MAMQERYDFTRGWPFQPAPPRAGRISREELDQRQAALTRSPLFAMLSRGHLRTIARGTAVLRQPKGKEIVKEGTAGSTFFVILEGEARVVRGGRTLRRLHPGDYFGEISLLDGEPRSASVIADSDMICLSLSGQDFRTMLAGEPRIMMQIVKDLAGRLRRGERVQD
jgi:CRP-like cAMP-binding protein